MLLIVPIVGFACALHDGPEWGHTLQRSAFGGNRAEPDQRQAIGGKRRR